MHKYWKIEMCWNLEIKNNNYEEGERDWILKKEGKVVGETSIGMERVR